ncbi:MAG: hypothetical protein RL557_122 [archaeon]|jgi:hypothetical protein
MPIISFVVITLAYVIYFVYDRIFIQPYCEGFGCAGPLISILIYPAFVGGLTIGSFILAMIIYFYKDRYNKI